MKSFLETAILGVLGFILGYFFRPVAGMIWSIVWRMINVVLGKELPFSMQATGDSFIHNTIFVPVLFAVLAMWIWHIRRKRKEEAGLYIG